MGGIKEMGGRTDLGEEKNWGHLETEHRANQNRIRRSAENVLE
jgi:hypothetical protein